MYFNLNGNIFSISSECVLLNTSSEGSITTLRWGLMIVLGVLYFSPSVVLTLCFLVPNR